MSVRNVVFPAGRQALYEQNRYSPAIQSNGFLFVSGQVGSRPDGSPEPDVAQQVRLAFENLNAILAAAGCTFDDVIDVTGQRRRFPVQSVTGKADDAEQPRQALMGAPF